MESIEQFLRPVCCRGFPGDLLPEALKRDNARGMRRGIDGEMSKA
jgi:NADP-dependent aldehyde dehydrogenase